jgi:3-hydroxyisobutyrate dehydrogenase
MLPTGQIVRDVYLLEQDGGLARYLARDTVAIDMSSSEPSGTRQLGAALAKRGLILLDAPVSGAVPRAQSGTLTIMLGGDDATAIERSKLLLSAMGNRIFETGGLGSGHAMKALNNFVAATSYTAAAEALLVGQRFGLDPARMLEILNVSTGRNFITEVVMKEHVVDRKFATGFALGLLAKDVKIAADLANEMQQDAPLAQLIKERWALARDRLGATRDNSEAILAWDNGGRKA